MKDPADRHPDEDVPAEEAAVDGALAFATTDVAFDELPTGRMVALSEQSAEALLRPEGWIPPPSIKAGTMPAPKRTNNTGADVPPSPAPPPSDAPTKRTLQLQLQTAQVSAVTDETLRALDARVAAGKKAAQVAPINVSRNAPKKRRGPMVMVVLSIAVAAGAAIAWSMHPPNDDSRVAPETRLEPSTPDTPASEAPAARAGSGLNSNTPGGEETHEAASNPGDEATPRSRPMQPNRSRGPRDAETAERLFQEAMLREGPARIVGLESAAAQDGQNPHPAAALAEAHLAHDPALSLAWAEHASRLRRRRPRYRELVADALERLGRDAEARAARDDADRLRTPE